MWERLERANNGRRCLEKINERGGVRSSMFIISITD